MIAHRALLVVIAFVGIGFSALGQPETRRPNIVLIVADDLGWTDLGHAGSDFHRTPHLDALAAAGMRFTQAYSNAPNCAPTRACLMSGLYTPRHGVYTVGSGARGQKRFRKLVPVENRKTLSQDVVTLPERLSESYAKGHFGKWHLGDAPDRGPLQQGFDFNIAGTNAGHPKSYFSPYSNAALEDGPEGEYLTDRLTDEAIAWLDEVKDRPFFLYLPYYAVHTPIQPPSAALERCEARERGEHHRNAAYAAMVENLDACIGRLLQAIDDRDLRERTLVVFTSDNGGLGGYRRAGVDAREVTDNWPLRGGKGMLYEGGIRVPLLARWPGRIPAGSTCEEPVISLDLHPTLIEISGAGIDGETRLDGVSLVPLLEGRRDRLSEARALYWHFPGYLQGNAQKGAWRTTPAGAIRRGPYKLLEFFEDGRLEMYDLDQDIGETRDLSAEQPARVRELHAELRGWRAGARAPMPSPRPLPAEHKEGSGDGESP